MGSLLMSVTPQWEQAHPTPAATFSWKALSREHWGCLRSRGPVSEKALPSQVSWIWAVSEASRQTQWILTEDEGQWNRMTPPDISSVGLWQPGKMNTVNLLSARDRSSREKSCPVLEIGSALTPTAAQVTGDPELILQE